MKMNKKLISLGLLSLLLVGCNHGGVNSISKEKFEKFYDSIKAEKNRHFKLGDSLEIIVDRTEGSVKHNNDIVLSSSGIADWEDTEKQNGEALSYKLEKKEGALTRVRYEGSLIHSDEKKTVKEDDEDPESESHLEETEKDTYLESYSLANGNTGTKQYVSSVKKVYEGNTAEDEELDSTTRENTMYFLTNELGVPDEDAEYSYERDVTFQGSFSHKKVNAANPVITYAETATIKETATPKGAGDKEYRTIRENETYQISRQYLETSMDIEVAKWNEEKSDWNPVLTHENQNVKNDKSGDNWIVTETITTDTWVLSDSGARVDSENVVVVNRYTNTGEHLWSLDTTTTTTTYNAAESKWNDPVIDVTPTQDNVSKNFDQYEFNVDGALDHCKVSGMLAEFKTSEGLEKTIEELDAEYGKAFTDFETDKAKPTTETLYQNGMYQYRAANNDDATEFVQYTFFDSKLSVTGTPVISEIAKFTKNGHEVVRNDRTTFIYKTLTPLEV